MRLLRARALPGATPIRSAVAALLITSAVFAAPVLPASAGTGTISGTAFHDVNRDGVKQSGEAGIANHRIYVFDGAGAYMGKGVTDVAGSYSLGGLADGTYEVVLATGDWWSIRDALVPTTTGTQWPRHTVQVSGSARADFGWRPIVRSTDLSAPISEHVGGEGLKVQSYNDAVGAEQIHDALLSGTAIGAEASKITVRFDAGGTMCATAAVKSGDTYISFTATCSIAYTAWLDSVDTVLFHEYGHAWSEYYAAMVQGDPSLAGYLEVRGLTGDTRLESSHGWDRDELIAEDYRQLFGSPSAAASPQMNREVPAAADVPGLRDYLALTFRGLTTGGDTTDDGTTTGGDGTTTGGGTTGDDGTTTSTLVAKVSDLDGRSASLKGGSRRAEAAVAVTDSNGVAISGADVTLAWSTQKGRTGQAVCRTDAGGRCQVGQTLEKKQGAVTFQVSAVVAGDLPYDGQSNSDPDGDSDGTTLVVA